MSVRRSRDVYEKEVEPKNSKTDSSAALLVELYDELRRIAATQLARAGPYSTLQATALVHEAWLRLGRRASADWSDQSHFVAAATEAMRHILIDRARRRRALRHGGTQQRVDLELDRIAIPVALHTDEELLALDGAVEKLASQHPAAAALVKLHCFTGLGVSEAGALLGLTRSAAYRRLLFARAWLEEELSAHL
jgi:RNA polymerase sigma factor (TIGR02999 family)